MDPDPEVHLRDGVGAEGGCNVEEQSHLDPVALVEGDPIEDTSPQRSLARQRLCDGRERGEQQLQDGASGELGDPTSARGLALERALVEALHQLKPVVEQQWARQADDVVGRRVDDVTIEEDDHVAVGLGDAQRHGRPLAAAAISADDACTCMGRSSRRPIVGAVIDDDDLVE